MTTSFATKLQELMTTHRTTNRKLADYVGCTNGYITYLKKGQRTNPSGAIIKLIAQFYAIDPSELTVLLDHPAINNSDSALNT